MSIYATIEGIGDHGDPERLGAPWAYQGSHILPADSDPRGGEIGLALILIGGLVDPEVTDHGWPDATWGAGYFAQRVARAHDAVTGWAANHSTEQLAHLLEAAADRAKAMEAA